MRLYVVTRADLSPGQQATQAAHALADFAAARRPLFERWHAGTNTLVMLTVPDERALEDLCTAIAEIEAGAHWTTREPDLDDALTGVAVVETAATKKLTRGLPLLLRSC